MREFLEKLEKAENLQEIHNLIDSVLQDVRAGQSKAQERRLFLRNLAFNEAMIRDLTTARALDHLVAQISRKEWTQFFGSAVEKEWSRLMVDLVDGLVDVSHQQLLRLLPEGPPKVIFATLKSLNTYLEKQEGSARCQRGMRVARIMVDLYRILARDTKFWKRSTPPACCIDSERITALKEEKKIDELSAAYEARINQLQRIDLRRNLAALSEQAETPRMDGSDFDRTFQVRAPLRLGISSANASDNHLRSKEQGAKTLNAGIDLQMEGESSAAPPLRVTARRLSEPKLLLRSLSMDFKADFEIGGRGNATTQSELFFAYRRGGDEALRLVKQALVHTGIVREGSDDVVRDIATFTDGGGLEITTESKVMQGSGLGTSSILAAAVLKMLYRLYRHPYATTAQEYPALYDQSLLLEQSIGLNSGWQDARGACGGPSAVKNFYAPPTDELPAPQRTFLTEIDAEQFTERVVLFDTGIARAATRGLNVVLDAYLTRDPERFGAVRESMAIHDRMVAALRAGNFAALGELALHYWQLRCILDPDATNDALQHLFEAPEFTQVSEGGLITGAGGGGFALLIARPGCGEELRSRLNKLRKNAAYARSSVVAYQLDKTGIQLSS